MDSFKSVIDLAGSRAEDRDALARALGVRTRAIWGMRARDWVSAEYWVRLHEYMGARGRVVTYETLARLAARRAPARPDNAA